MSNSVELFFVGQEMECLLTEEMLSEVNEYGTQEIALIVDKDGSISIHPRILECIAPQNFFQMYYSRGCKIVNNSCVSLNKFEQAVKF